MRLVDQKAMAFVNFMVKEKGCLRIVVNPCIIIDAETAASAVRNLNDYEIGGRQLRVDYAAMDDNHQRSGHQGRHHHPPVQQAPPPSMPPPQPMSMQPPMQSMPMQPPMQPSMQPPMQPPMQSSMQVPMQAPMQAPMQTPMQPPMQPPVNKSLVGNASVDEISKVLASMNAQDLFTLMSQMKQMSFERPEFTREFLAANPQVAYALFQAMLMMNIVDPNIITVKKRIVRLYAYTNILLKAHHDS